MQRISLKDIIARFKWRITFTFALILLSAGLGVLIPLAIGRAIDGLLAGHHQGIIELGILGLLMLIVGSAQRFYDTRIYAGIYRKIAPEMVAAEYDNNTPVSTISARTSLLTEIVEFLESSMPELVRAIIAVIGSVVIIASLDFTVFLACIALLLLITAIYTITGSFNYSLNAGYNDQLEQQVNVLESRDTTQIKNHFRTLMRWNIKLSDLETANYFIIWLGVIALLVSTPVIVIGKGVLQYGLVFSIIMYVFECIESVVTFPIYIQQLIRLQEISKRLSGSGNDSALA